ncbi:NUDIX domain-containing protein [Georgenia sp. TF02-10]|uniref:NUDIX domain-containing protein n=1 Tax=Georgenia sp. TF02-10 TaxID=2917725 RepID=UPI001FA6C2A2|nr:NUDIX domain-containing protein [Georgenia sp. TF02-10]UNX55678.1 NUDIX domain-containing protein [Georgenia sp. TF02-10]
MTADRPPDARPQREPGDGWVACACGEQHWGLVGAAGLLLRRRGDDGVELVLQHRALWSHHGGTWGLPGGALHLGERPTDGAVREAMEEAGVEPETIRVRADRALVHPDWSYTTVLAEAVAPWEPRVTDRESLQVRWVPLRDLGSYQLLPAFADALPELRQMLRRLVLVVDAANVVGSRPDGWWKDRAGATARLRDHLAGLATAGLAAEDLGLPGRRWYPEIVLVTEGAARTVQPAGGVQVRAADGAGDDAIVRAARAAAQDGTVVAVATADRELQGRVRAVGAHPVPPRLVRN